MMSRALLATAALHTYSCGANLCDLCELFLHCCRRRWIAGLSAALFQAVGQCSDAHHGNNLQPIHRIFEVLKKKKNVSEVSEELRSPLDALQAFSDETLPAVSALRLSGNLIPVS